MKKTISIVIAGLITLMVLFSIPSKAIDTTKILDSKTQYAAVPPFEKPIRPPKK